MRRARYCAAVMVTILALVLVTSCNGKSGSSSSASGVSAASASADPELSGACPTNGNSRAFAKTRFALHAGLALGAFHRYIYKPLKNGGFKAGADKRKRSFAKAAIAGVFVVHEVKVANGFAQANPTLCGAGQRLSNTFSTLTSKLRSGTATEADVNSAETAFTGLEQTAKQGGFNFSERNVTVPGAS
ncbi:hypothetical protein [Frankia sp. AgKG'84/4]|uniref:hypothetical protein n=1 Tax=Frankia sp. AgKG'84/4 TaxID=573490 RepID=UPI00200DE905|nr:hypothetical protein [Frankia sp. AgKG'84/4]MCL9794924.1 hypothetical protein [Frankia sp. AgKG'84/4]